MRSIVWVYLTLAIPVVFFSAGCNRSKPSAKKTDKAAKDNREDALGAEQLLQSVFGMLRRIPERQLYPTSLNQLNQYLKRRDDIPEVPDETRQQVVTLLGPQSLGELESELLTPIDLDYLISSIFFQTVNQNLNTEQYEALPCAQKLFDWVNMNIQVVPMGTQAMAPPMDVCIRGTGNSHEKTWVFLELLRQASLTGCVVAVPSENGNLIPWLAGVVANDQIHLFHPELGIAVPSAQNADQIATLAELEQNPELLDAIGIPKELKFAVAPENTEKLSILVILEASMLSPKLQHLQSRLTGDQRVNLHLDYEDLFSRVQTAMADSKKVEGLRVWQRPYQIRSEIYRDPNVFKEFQSTMNLFWQRMDQSPRMLQLRGYHEQAVQEFVKLDMEFRPEQVNQMLKQAGIDAAKRGQLISRTRQDILYFGGVSQLNVPSPRPEVAKDWFDRYLTEYGTPLLREDDILAWGEFCARLVSEGKQETASVAKRLWTLLPDDAKQIVSQVAESAGALRQLESEIVQLKTAVQSMREQRAEYGTDEELQEQFALATQLLRTKGEQLQEGLRLDLQSRRMLVSAINEQLKKTDFYDEKAMGADSLPEAGQKILDELQKESSPVMWIRFNRQLLDRTFAAQISRSLNLWVPGALRHKALALRLSGDKAAGMMVLDETEDLPAYYRAILHAQKFQWEREDAAEAKPAQE